MQLQRAITILLADVQDSINAHVFIESMPFLLQQKVKRHGNHPVDSDGNNSHCFQPGIAFTSDISL